MGLALRCALRHSRKQRQKTQIQLGPGEHPSFELDDAVVPKITAHALNERGDCGAVARRTGHELERVVRGRQNRVVVSLNVQVLQKRLTNGSRRFQGSSAKINNRNRRSALDADGALRLCGLSKRCVADERRAARGKRLQEKVTSWKSMVRHTDFLNVSASL